MSFGKSKHHLTKILRYAHRDAENDAFLATLKIPRIQENPDLTFTTSSTAQYATSGVSTVKGPKTYYAKPSSFSKEAFLSNVNFTIGPFSSHFKLGENNYMNLNKIRIITKIRVHCVSQLIQKSIIPNCNQPLQTQTLQQPTVTLITLKHID